MVVNTTSDLKPYNRSSAHRPSQLAHDLIIIFLIQRNGDGEEEAVLTTVCSNDLMSVPSFCSVQPAASERDNQYAAMLPSIVPLSSLLPLLFAVLP